MSFFRGDRPLSHFLRHDPFSPISPISRPTLNPFYSPFFTVFEEPRGRYHDPTPQQQPTLTQGSSKPSPSAKSDSTPQHQQASQSSQEVTRTGGDDSQVERRHRRHRGRHEHQHPLSVLGGSPFSGSAWPSLFNSALGPFAPLTAAVQAIPDISVDVHSTPQAYTINASVPGMDKNDIKVTVDDGVLTIEAERKEARTRQPTNTNSSNSTSSTTSGSSSTTSATPSTANSQSSTEMKEESKEEKIAAPTTSSSSNAASTPSGDNATASSSTNASNAATATNGASAMEEDPEDFHYSETFYGRVERSIQLPEDAKVDELTAKYENGVLKIDIPRVQEQKNRGRRIEIQ